LQVPVAVTPFVSPWQFVEQHAASVAHASPSVVQVALVEPAGRAAHFESAPQTPEQHCESSAQVSVVWRQTVDEQVAPAVPAFGQLSEQHWASEPQAAPGWSQKSASVQAPPLQTPEQHCESPVHAVAAARQVGVGGSMHFVPSQAPLQQSFAAAQASLRREHCPTGSTQSPPAQFPAQHWSEVSQSLPMRPHPELASTHVTPLQSPEQQSEGWAQAASSARHSPGGATQVFATQLPEQQSAATEQLAPSWPAVHV
jgi:hypothetical protein